MLIKDLQPSVSDHNNSQYMNINVDSKAFSMLYAGIYSDPYRAIVRELISNAIDASVKANINKPVIFGLPELVNEKVYVQDFANGMTIEKIMEVYATFLSSDKENDGEQIGGFGLGGKTPYMYTDYFRIETTSSEDNVRRTFICHKNNQKPVINYVDELDVIDSNIKGTKVSFNLKKLEDVQKFIFGFSDMIYSKYPIDIKLGSFNRKHVLKIMNFNINKIDKITKSLNVNSYYFANNKNEISENYLEKFYNNNTPYDDNNINIRLGGVYYKYKGIKINKVEKIAKKVEIAISLNRMIYDYDNDSIFIRNFYCIIDNKFNGDIELSASREEIIKNKKNNIVIESLLINRVNSFSDKTIEKTTKYLDSLELNFDNMKKILRLKNLITNILQYYIKYYDDKEKINKLISHYNLVYTKFKNAFNINVSYLYKNKVNLYDNDISISESFYKNIIKKTSFYRENELNFQPDFSLNSVFNFLDITYGKQYFNYEEICDFSFFFIVMNSVDYLANKVLIINIDTDISKINKTTLSKINNNIKKEFYNNADNINCRGDKSLYFLYVKDYNEAHYNLSEEIEKNKNTNKSLKPTKIEKNLFEENITLIDSISKLVTDKSVNEYKQIVDFIKNDSITILVPDFNDIRNSDSKIDIIFKRYLYNSNPNKKTIKLFEKLFDKDGDSVVEFKSIPKDIYKQLVDEEKINSSIFKEVLKKYSALFSRLVDVLTISDNNINQSLGLIDKIKTRLLKEELNILETDFIEKIVNNIINEIIETTTFYKYYEKISVDDHISNINKFKETEYYINTNNMNINLERLFNYNNNNNNNIIDCDDNISFSYVNLTDVQELLMKINKFGAQISIENLDKILLRKDNNINNYLDLVHSPMYKMSSLINLSKCINYIFDEYKIKIKNTNKNKLFINPILQKAVNMHEEGSF